MEPVKILGVVTGVIMEVEKLEMLYSVEVEAVFCEYRPEEMPVILLLEMVGPCFTV